jgi:hypothetical protein
VRLRLLAAAIGATVLGLSFAASASARQSDWYVTAKVAESVTNRAFKEMTPSVPMGTHCFGVGGSLAPNDPGGQRFYPRFRCTVTMYGPSTTPKIKVTFRVRNKVWATLYRGWYDYSRKIGDYRWRG